MLATAAVPIRTNLTQKQKVYVEHILDGKSPVEAAEKAYETVNPYSMVAHNQSQPNVLAYLRGCLNKSPNTRLEGVASKLSATMEAKKVLNDGTIADAPDTSNQLRATELVLKLHGALSSDDGAKTINNTQFNVTATLNGDFTGLLQRIDGMHSNVFANGLQAGSCIDADIVQPIDTQ